MADPAPSQAQLVAQNNQARAAVLAFGQEMLQQIYSVGQVPTSSNIYNVPVRNVGLVRGFLVRVNGTVNNTAAGTLALTPFGLANVLSQITLTDFNNTVRIQTTGWHLNMIDCAKQPMVFAGAYSPNVGIDYGANFDVMVAPATVATTVDGVLQVYYYVPCAYAKNDLRGALWANVINSVATLQLTLNPTPNVATAGNPTGAVYKSNNAAAPGQWKADTNVTVTVWQDYLDQIPGANAGTPILPLIDLQTIYELKNTSLNGLAVGQDFNVPFANFRVFLSAAVIYDNASTLNVGSDVNYWALRAANTTEIFKYGPLESAFMSRTIFLADPPDGTYFFSFRTKPINTQQYGNMNLVLNPSVVTSSASQLLIGFEAFATVSGVAYASALPAG